MQAVYCKVNENPLRKLKGDKKMRVYIASVYGRRHGLSDEECEVNTMKAIGIGRELIKRGHKPFIPHLFHWVHLHWSESPDETIYFNLVAEWIQFCDALLVGEIPPWKNSGVQREIDMAYDLKIPVYWDIEQVPNYL